jgi:hypothetical protein
VVNEMPSWYATCYDNFSAGNNISSTTSATRALKYTLKWDGKDDKGNLLKKGTSTIYIESAREHGTYQLMSKDITVSKPQHIITGNTEISSASLDYLNRYGISDYASDFLIEHHQCSLSFKGPGYSADVFINRDDGKFRLTELRMGLVAVMNDLHKGHDTGKGWNWVIDISSVFLTLVSISGF